MEPPKIVITQEKLNDGSLIRKTSIRRRKSLKDEKKTIKDNYGTMFEEYEQIKNAMMQDRGVQNTTEALQERWRMIKFMYDDCVDMITTKRNDRLLRQQQKQIRELIAYLIIYSAVIFPLILLFIILLIFIYY